ncbi:MAG: leucine-rich repeat protein [Clostridia bacterium]|nr:leucine-rich repeat protein [Clostridia bacterium]
MIKKRFLKIAILAITVSIMALICAIAIIGASETKSYTVSYYSNGVLAQSIPLQEGTKHIVLSTPFASNNANKQFYGWYDETGKFYKNMEITVNKNYTFYEAYGMIVTDKSEFVRAIGQAGNYVRLGASITLDEVITLPTNGLVIIDLNGYDITVTSEEYAFYTENASVHILNSSTTGTGKITHTGVATNLDLMNASLFRFAPSLKKNASIHLFKNANIQSNVGLFDIVSDLTYSKYTYNIDVDSAISGEFIVRTYGINDASFTMHENAYVTVLGQYAFEDRGNCDGINLTFNMSTGKLDIQSNTFITNELSKYNVYITGGSFKRSLSHLYSNYTFVSNSGRYDFSKCAHSDIIVGMTATCTEAGTVTYKCSLCGTVHTEDSKAIGHTSVKKLVQEAVATKDTTEPGYYATTCQRCGYEEKEFFYPDPKDVYISVRLRNKDGVERTVRVKATDVFSDNVGERLQSFSTSLIESQYGVKQSEIISIEIPLGVKTIAGGIGHQDGNPMGLFYKNPHLEEIVLPMSIENIEATAFAYIDTLLTVKGLEYVTGTIDKQAFKQNATSKLFIERMELNAKTIGEEAFYNATMISLSFGKNVNSIGARAFGLSEGITTKLLEIFVEGNENKMYNHALLSKYNNDFKCFSSLNSGHQFDNLGIVYVDHNFIIETTHPTCQEGGYDFMKCEYCGAEEIGNYTDSVPHNYQVIDPPVQSTCSTQGYEGTMCSMCKDVNITLYYPYDPQTHDYTFDSTFSHNDICENEYHIIGVCRCGEKDPNPANWTWMPAKGEHEWDENNPIEYVAPTCGEDGYSLVDCTNCGFEVIITQKATGKHTRVTDNKNSIPATCSTEGKMVWVCDVCGDSKENSVPKNKDNHEWEKDDKGNLVWTVKVEATAEKAGTAQNKCLGCNKTQTRGIPVTSEQTEEISNLVLILLIVGGVILVGGGLGITLYYTVFRKNASSGYKYKFNTLGKKYK